MAASISPSQILMKANRTNVAVAIVAIAILIALSYQFAFLGRTNGKSLIGKPVAEAVSVFLPPENLAGRSYVFLSDAYTDECNERHGEFIDLIVKLRKAGLKVQMLHSSQHAFPAKSYDDSVSLNRGAPNHVIIADSSVLYAEPLIRRLPKPALIVLDDEIVVDLLSGDEFEEWIGMNR